METKKQGSPVGFGCSIIIAGVVLATPLMLMDRCSNAPPPPPTAAELAADEAKQNEEERFQREQAPLWSKPASTLNVEAMRSEIAKCRAMINPVGAVEAYLTEPDEKEEIESIRSSGTVTIMGQRRNPFGSIEVKKFTCHFRGAGFERLSSQEGGTMDKFVP